MRDVVEAHASAETVAEAKALLAKTLAAAIQRFHDQHGGKAAAQVVIVNDAAQPVALHSAARMLIKGDTSACPSPPCPRPCRPAVPLAISVTDYKVARFADNADKGIRRDVKQWYGKVAALGVGVIMIATTAAGIICLCAMPTGQDSLLYVRQKED